MGAVKRRPSRKPRRRLSRPASLSQLGTRLRFGLLLLIGLCLALALRCLELIGPPPRLRIDALWVKQNEYMVRVMVTGLIVAATATGLLIFSRRGMTFVIALWGLAIFTAIWLYSDRIWIILRIVAQHGSG